MKILWVEDGGGGFQASQVCKSLFNPLLGDNAMSGYKRRSEFHLELPRLFAENSEGHELVVCRSFEDWAEISQSGAMDFDVALLDINLSAYITVEPPLNLQDFDLRAGLYIYHRLIAEHGFAPQNIAFFSGEGGTMDHFEETCKAGMLEPPQNRFEKKTKDYSRIGAWLKELANSPYHRLRRGILDACQQLRHEIDQATEGDLESTFHLFRPINPRLRSDWPAYRERVEQFVLRLRRSLPMVQPQDLSEHYRRLVEDLTSPWQSKLTASAIPDHQEQVTEAIFRRSSPRLLRLLNDWASRDLLSDHLTEGEVALIALLAARNWRSAFQSELASYEQALVDLLPEPIEASELLTRLETASREELSNSHRDLALRIPGASQQGHLVDFLGLCESLGHQRNTSEDATTFDAIREHSITLVYQSFWHCLSPTSLDPMLPFEIPTLAKGGILETLGCRTYDRAFRLERSE